MRSVIALVAAAWLLVAGAELALPNHTAHHPHALSTVEIADHAHIGDGNQHAVHEAFVAAVLPRLTTGLAALGLVAVVAALASSFAHFVLPTMRGPPRRSGTVLTGQHLLARLCIARR